MKLDVSHPDRVIFPVPGFTKADVVNYYRRVGAVMMPFLERRPLTLQRFPRGLGAKGFMQKNAAKHFPDSIERFPVPKRDGSLTHYPVITQADDLAYLANQGTITFHMWTATVDRPTHPDWMVFDLDPDADDVAGARFGLQAVREVLADFGVEGFALATGSKGFHLWVRLDGNQPFTEVSLATRAIAGLTAMKHPDRLTTAFLKRDRAGRVFVDWLRNTNIATVVVPFSLRPRPNASVAVPLNWDEVDTAVPDAWTLDSIDDRFAIPTDPPRCVVPVDDIVATARAAGVDLDTPHDRFGR